MRHVPVGSRTVSARFLSPIFYYKRPQCVTADSQQLIGEEGRRGKDEGGEPRATARSREKNTKVRYLRSGGRSATEPLSARAPPLYASAIWHPRDVQKSIAISSLLRVNLAKKSMGLDGWRCTSEYRKPNSSFSFKLES